MLSFFAVRGITPQYILSLPRIEQEFYKCSMELYYDEMIPILKIIGGVRVG